jgi:hypothetical protein
MMYLTPWKWHKTGARTDLRRYDLDGEVIADIVKTYTNDADYSMLIRLGILRHHIYPSMQEAIDACDKLLVEKFGCVLLSEEQWKMVSVLV